MVLFDVFIPFSPAMLPTTRNNVSSPAQNMVHVLNARLLLRTFKTRHQQKIELANGRNKSSRRPGSKQIAVLKNFIHTVCQKMLPAMSISHSGMASHSATFIDQSHPTFYTNCTKEFLSIWLIGARESSLLRNLTIKFEHFHLLMVFNSSKMVFSPCLKYRVLKEKPWQRSSLAASLALGCMPAQGIAAVTALLDFIYLAQY